MAIENFQFLDKQSIRALVAQLLTKTNVRVDERIVQSIDENSSDKQTLSAKALYDLISALNADNSDYSNRLNEHDTTLPVHAAGINDLNTTQEEQSGKLSDIDTDLTALTSEVNSFTHLNIQTVTGDISTVLDPSDSILYFQRDNEADTMWMLYIYKDGHGWVNIGDTEVDLTVIWSKDETEQLREELGIHDVEAVSNDDIMTAVENAFNASAGF